MRILIVGVNSFLEEGLREIGVEVERWIPEYDKGLADALLRCKDKPDVILINEDLNRRYFPFDIGEKDLPLVCFYGIDVHLNSYWHECAAKLVDVFFSTQRSYLERFKRQNPNSFHLPWAIKEEIIYDDGRERDIEISFVGNMDPHRRKRRNIIDLVKKHFPMVVRSKISREEMAEIYRRSKIVINESVSGEVNFRYFEAMGCGAMLLTEDVKELYYLFIPNIHLVTYNPANLLSKLSYYLKAHQEREEIRKRGRDLVHRCHTERERAKSFLRIVKRCQKRRRFDRETLDKLYYFLLSRALMDKVGIEAIRHKVSDSLYGALYKGLLEGNLHARALSALKEDSPFYHFILCGHHALIRGAKDLAKRLLIKGVEKAERGGVWKHLLFKNIWKERMKTPYFYYLLGRLYEENGRVLERGYMKMDAAVNPLFAVDFYRISTSIEPNFFPSVERLGLIFSSQDPPIVDVDIETVIGTCLREKTPKPITEALEKLVFYSYTLSL